MPHETSLLSYIQNGSTNDPSKPHGLTLIHSVSDTPLKKEQYKIPDFQRDYVWSKNDASKFIESLLLGLPVPGIFLYKEADSQTHLVIDGQQRRKSLQKYYKGLFGSQVFKLSGLKSKWNGKSYEELDEDDQTRLDDAIIHVTIFKQDTPTNNMDSVYEVYERINTGGMRLSPQEIRSGPVAYLCRPKCSFKPLFFRRRPGFSSPMQNAVGVDCRSH